VKELCLTPQQNVGSSVFVGSTFSIKDKLGEWVPRWLTSEKKKNVSSNYIFWQIIVIERLLIIIDLTGIKKIAYFLI
jgi:hypothetical protein